MPFVPFAVYVCIRPSPPGTTGRSSLISLQLYIITDLLDGMMPINLEFRKNSNQQWVHKSKPVELTKINELLNRLREIKLSDYSLSSPPKDQTNFYKLFGSDNNLLFKLSWGKTAKKGLHEASSNLSKIPFKVDSRSIESLPSEELISKIEKAEPKQKVKN